MLTTRPPSLRGPFLADPDATLLCPDGPYLDAVRDLLGVIHLDPCSSSRAQAVIAAQSWFRADQVDASLAQEWRGNVFLHPHPNARIERRQVQKLIRDYLNDRIPSALLLTGRSDLLRTEPLLLSFPFVLHLQRMKHWRWNAEKQALEGIWPSHNNLTVYLPRRQGTMFDNGAIDRFCHLFQRFGRPTLSEDLGDEWQTHALTTTHRWPIKPILTTTRFDRHGAA
ncbi:MAG: hypothetical protein WBM08_08140 [Prochlorococcaceae cyanobacterium]